MFYDQKREADQFGGREMVETRIDIGMEMDIAQ